MTGKPKKNPGYQESLLIALYDCTMLSDIDFSRYPDVYYSQKWNFVKHCEIVSIKMNIANPELFKNICRELFHTCFIIVSLRGVDSTILVIQFEHAFIECSPLLVLFFMEIEFKEYDQTTKLSQIKLIKSQILTFVSSYLGLTRI